MNGRGIPAMSLLPPGMFGYVEGKECITSCVNPPFDVLFKVMKNQDDTPERLAILQQMTRMIQDGAPWIFSFHPKSYVLSLAWLKNHKLSAVGHTALKCLRVDAEAREKARSDWNQPVLWSLA